MPQYKKLALHNSVCNEVFFQLQDCQAEHPFAKFIGECTSFNKKLERCIKDNLEQMRANNHLQSVARQNRFSESSSNQ